MAHPRLKKYSTSVIGNTVCNNFSLFAYSAFFQITVVLHGPGFMRNLHDVNYKCDSLANFEIITDQLNPSDGGECGICRHLKSSPQWAACLRLHDMKFFLLPSEGQ
jgi:hypothetical protein